MQMLYVNYKKMTATAKEPKKGSKGAAGLDLYADTEQDIVVEPGETVPFYTGLAFEIPKGYCGLILSRSGIGTHRRLRLPHCVGLLDDDYRGNVSVPMCNDSNIPQVVKAHERIAQLLIVEKPEIKLVEKEELSATERGAGGFGSTGR